MSFKKKIILVLLATAVVVPKDLAVHAMGLPALIGHYVHHYMHHEHVSFSDFLALHESDSVHHDSDGHDKMPCHHHHSSDCFQPSNVVAQVPLAEFNLYCFGTVSRAVCVYNKAWVSSYSVSFWQPPRIG